MKAYLFSTILFFSCMTNHSQTVMPLYKDSIPNSKPSKDEETEKTDHGITIISKISRPTLTVFLPAVDKANGTAVVICPGGGYWITASSHEGSDVAKKLNEMGIAAFVLKYRIPDDATMLNKEIGPLQDAQQAIKIVREHAAEWKVNPQRVGIMGFSAGGHLASTAGTHFNHPVIANTNNTSLRPDFMILIYPVISFQDSTTHLGSRNQLLGNNPTQEKKNEYSGELNVTNETPPAFLVHATDDNAVKSLNSVLFYTALVQHHIPAEMHIYTAGGHGFGMNNKTSNDKWIDRLQNWFDGNGWLKNK